MSVLTIALTDLKPLCGIDPGDTSSDAALTALLTAQQPVFEYALDPAILAQASGDPGLSATLVLGIAEALAGEFLKQSARPPGATDDFHLGLLTVTASRTDSPAQMGERLAAAGVKRLEPFTRASKRLAFDASGGTPDGSAKTPTLGQAEIVPSLFDEPGLFDAVCAGEGLP